MDKVIDDLIALGKGLRVTFQNFLEKPVTDHFPEQKRQVPERTRGRHVLHRYEDGMERCVGCLLCQSACPAGAIYIEADQNTEDNPVSKGERHAKVFDIDLLRCIYCGYCEMACPTNAITLENNTALAGYTRESMLITKEQLLESKDSSTLGTTVFWDPKVPEDQKDIVASESGHFEGSYSTAAAVGRGDLAPQQEVSNPLKEEDKTDE